MLVAGAALIAGAWLLAPLPGLPLYDGLQPPPEPYRYLNPPPGSQQTAPPTSASKDLALSNGAVPAAFVSTGETPPQAQVLVGDATLIAPAGAHTVTLGIRPVPPPSALPGSLGHRVGNVYLITATADAGGQASLKPGATPPTVILRGPPGSSAARIARAGAGSGGWVLLQTVPIGAGVQNTVAANTTSLGYFTLVVPAGAATSSTSTGTGNPSSGSFPVVAVVVPLAVVLAVAGLLLAVRRSRAGAARGSAGSSRRGGGRRR
jgi:hypothetical protein